MARISSILHSEVHSHFHGTFPKPVLASILKAIFQDYRDASEHCFSSFRFPQAKDVSGHYRRGKVEDDLLAIADRFKEREFPELNAEPLKYKHNTASYVEMTYRTIKLTQSCVLSSDDLPRDAEFRNSLAETGQLGLFTEPGAADTEENKYLYCIVLHGVHKDAQKRERCAFACVRFPDKRFEGYIGGPINLFEMFPAIVQEYYGAEKVQEEPLVAPKRRKKAAGAE